MSSQPIQGVPRVTGRRRKTGLASCVILLDEREIRIPSSAYTLAGFRAWATSDDAPEDVRICFIDQEILIDMSGEEIETHNKVKTEITRTLANLNEELDLGEFYSDGTRLSNEEANLSCEPDTAFARWETLESGRARLVPRKDREGHYLELEGPPDLVVEILSDSSVGKDTRRLRPAYHRAGIPEYWLIDARGEEIDFQIFHLQPSGYTTVPPQRGWLKSGVFKRYFRLIRKPGRMGRWKYTLQVKRTR